MNIKLFTLLMCSAMGATGLWAHPQPFLAPSPAPVLQFDGPDQGNTSYYTAGIAGAVGPDHIMTIRNSSGINDPSISIYSKNGQLITTRSFNNYFASNISGFYDPRVAYDHIQQRWIATATAFYSGVKHLCVMYSKTSDPTGAWQTFVPILSFFSSMAQPKIGFSANWIAISCFYEDGSNNGSSIVYVWKRNEFFSGVNGTYWSSQGFNEGHLCPASTYDAGVGDLYLVSVNSPTSGGKIRVSRVFGSPASDPQFDLTGALINVNNAWSNTPLNAPQQGGSGILLPNQRINSAVYRNGSIWFAHNIFLPSTGTNRSVVQWGEVSAATNTLAQLGRIDSGTGNLMYGIPSISVDADNNVLVGFNKFSGTGYPSAAYAYHYGTDPAGYMNDVYTCKSGVSTFSQAWGDYSATCVDPVDNAMWTLQQYAKSTNKWGTQWAKIGDPGICGDPCGTADQEWISGITIDGSSGLLGTPGSVVGGCSGEVLFDAYYAELKIGASHTFTLTPGFSGAAQAEYWKIWIDLNHDGDLDDPSDLVFASASGSSATVQGTFFIPSTVVEGPALMRVAMRRGSPPPDCGNYAFGQVLNYASVYLDKCNLTFFSACEREYIQRVKVNTINNTSACGIDGFQDFTWISTTLHPDSSYQITLDPGYTSPDQHPERWLIWIDYNFDLDFDDPGELVFDSGPAGSVGAVTGAIHIPANTPKTTTLMRVKMIPVDDGYETLNPCSPPSGTMIPPDQYGEAEDYTVNINGETIEVNNDAPDNLIHEVLVGGDCYDITNVTYSGGSEQIGRFSKGLTNIGFSEGIILATGDIHVAEGPNDQNGAGGGGAGGNDVDLATIATGAMFDVAALEFDITPTQSTLALNYVFASEEYCEYVGTQFNDVFGIFISGPGIIGTQNIAVVPATNVPITINSINHFTNSGLYVPNTPAGLDNCENGGVPGTTPPVPPATGPATQELQYDGFTKKLTAFAQVTPCATYHIKIAIADVGDGIYDSAVFLKAGALSGGANASVSWLVNGQPGADHVVEGCGSAQILVQRLSSDNSTPLAVSFAVSGTATSGADYSPIPGTVIIPAGQDQLIFPVNIVNDMTSEGPETIILTPNNLCSCQHPLETLIIQDGAQLTLQADTVSLCPPTDVAALGVNVQGGTAPYSYQWSNGANDQQIFVQVVQSSSYTVTVTDACGATQTAVARVNFSAGPVAQLAGPAPQICPDGTGFITVHLTGSAPFELVYSLDGTTQSPVSGIPGNTFSLPVNTPGIYQGINVLDASGCLGSAGGVLNVTVSSLTLSGTATNTTCSSSGNGAINTTVSGGQSPFNYTWQGPSSIGNIADPVGLASGNYFVTVTDGVSCTVEESFTINAPPAISVTVLVNNHDLTIAASGGTGLLSYSINGVDFQFGNTFFNLLNGNYTVTVKDANGCIVTAPATIHGLSATAQVSGILCFGGEGGITVHANGGTPPYQYQLDNAGFQSDSVFQHLAVGTYSITVKDATGALFSAGSATLVSPAALQVAVSVDCDDAALTVSGGTPPYSSDPLAQNLHNLSNGMYQLTVVDMNGCSATASFTVDVPPLSLAFNTDSVDCFGSNTGSISLSGQGGCAPYMYQLSGSPFLPGGVFSNLTAGTYSCTVKDSRGIEQFMSVSVFQPVLLTIDTAVNGNTITCNGSGGVLPYSYSLNGGPAQSSGVFANLGSGIYTVVVTDANGCTAISPSLQVVVKTVDLSDKWGARVTPNPGTGLFRLTLAYAPESMYARVFDMAGRRVAAYDFHPQNGTLETDLDLQSVANGVYLLLLGDGREWGSLYLSKAGE